MKKILSLVLALAMLLTVVPALAESAEAKTDSSKSGLSDALGSLFGGSSEGESSAGLSDALGSLFGSSSESGSGDISSMLSGLMGGSSEGGSADISSLLGGLLGGSSSGGSGSGLSSLLGSLTGSSGEGLLSSLLGSLNSSKFSALISTLKDLLLSAVSNASGSSISSLLSGLMNRFSGSRSAGEGEAQSASSAGEILGLLLGGISEDTTDEEWAQWLEEYHNSPEYQEEQARKAVLEAYVLDEYKDVLDPGDVQLVCFGAGIDDLMEDGTAKYLRYFSLTNYKADGKNLKELNYSGNTELIYLAKNAEGKYEVKEAIPAEEGEKYYDSVKALSEKYGAELDTVTVNLGRKESAEVYSLAWYLREHPEYEKAEYQGELKTADELDVIYEELLTEALKDIDFSSLF